MISIRKLQERSNERQNKNLREAYKEQFGVSIEKILPDEQFMEREKDGTITIPMGFSFRALKESIRANIRRFREANAESAFQGLERYMVQKWTFGGYEQPRVAYPDIFRALPSKSFQEYYAPLWDGELPELLKNGQPIPDSRLVGLETVIKNEEIGRILSLPRTLFDRDQTGQIQEKVNRFGVRMREFEELLAMACVHYISWSNSLTGGSRNRLAAYTTNLTTGIKDGLKFMRKMKDPLGNFYAQVATHVLVGPGLEIDLLTVLNSIFYPAVTDQTATGAGPGVFAKNVLEGRVQPLVSDKLPDEDAILCVKGAGGVWQDEYPMEISQEAPNSGADFDRNQRRFKNYRRGNAGIIDVRTFFAINIDSVNVPTQLSDLETVITQTYTDINL